MRNLFPTMHGFLSTATALLDQSSVIFQLLSMLQKHGPRGAGVNSISLQFEGLELRVDTVHNLPHRRRPIPPCPLRAGSPTGGEEPLLFLLDGRGIVCETLCTTRSRSSDLRSKQRPRAPSDQRVTRPDLVGKVVEAIFEKRPCTKFY